ncbi:MAG: sugar ABC transporter ATP-binding protein [Bifidobacteriaceae bacterium]|jgi:erythritol transport system ATP-binding protein|nr:sugar ABC transporter ATP-binding protein [Bifidobacteriaceae bacterium]
MAVLDSSDNRVVLRARGIAKHYGGVRALKGVDFEIRAGKVTTLFGENGAGKSTLMKILAGVEKPTRGVLELGGTEVAFDNTSEALARGIAIIHQELNLAPNMSVRDNVFMGRELRTRSGGIDYAAEARAVRDAMERLEEDIDPSTLVSELRLGQQQIVEIAGALLADARILIMDEPTSALSAPEVEVLFRVIEELKSKGVAIVYISHHLEEALHVTDYAVVFRDGELVAQAPVEDIDMAWVIHKMVGHKVESTVGSRPPAELGEVLLSIRNIVVPDPLTAGRNVVDGVSIDVRAGELVCIYGLMGAGRTELMEAVAGRMQTSGGEVRLAKRSLAGASIRERIQMGLSLVPEDRQRDGLVQMMSIGRNMVLASISSFTRRGWLVSRTEAQRIQHGARETLVKMGSPKDLIGSLSGGNQQKVVISKTLLTNPKAMLLDEPTRGIDVGAKSEIFDLLAAQAKRGIGVLFVTSEIGEALTSSHRIVVMARGRIVREFATAEATRDEVMAASGENVAVLSESQETGEIQ